MLRQGLLNLYCSRLLSHFKASMDARTCVAVRAVALCVADANSWACSDNVRLRTVLELAFSAVREGDRGVALRLLARALGRRVPEMQQRGACTCSMCGRRVRSTYWRPADAWPDLSARERHLCAPCYRMRP